MTTLDNLLNGIVEEPQADDRWQVLADFLEEFDDPRRAELLRLHRRMLATCCEPELHPERAAWQAHSLELLVQGARPCVPQKTVVLAEDVGMTFSFIPPGSFLLGSPKSEEGRKNNETLHKVTLTKPYWLSVYPVTQAQWMAVRGNNPSRFQEDERQPVEQVSWDDCTEFCELLGEQFRLPTDAEWENACRAGTTTAFSTGDGLGAIKLAGWCNHDGTWGTGRRTLPGYLDYGEGAKTKPVGLFLVNNLGLFDMHGNVWEWCSDWIEPLSLSGAADTVDPVGLAFGTQRVIRGGCYFNEPAICRAAARFGFEPDGPKAAIGCRVCMDPH
jgi:uncharacterized protein (TIGR02996 family)